MPTTNNIKIVYFHLAFLYSGGGEKLALKEVELLKNQGYQVDCYAPLVDESECFPDILQKFKIKEIIPGFTKLFRNKPEIGVMITCILFPFIAAKYKKYDMVIGANQPGPIFGFILKILFNTPYIIYLAQPTRLIYPRPIDQKLGLKLKNTMQLLPHIVNIFRPFFFWIDLKSIAKSDVFLCNGLYMQDILTQIYGRKPIVCPGGAKTNKNSNDKYGQNLNAGTFKFRNLVIPKPYIFISNRHFPHKKLEYALEILDAMNQKIHILISGEPTQYTEQLKQLSAYYKLDKYVHFLGYVTESELDSLYSNTALYLYTAPEEDFGMGVVEAMGYGIPVIAWNNAGPSRVITDGYDGYLVNFNDKTKIVKIINNLLNNKESYNAISYNAIATVQTNYSWNNHLETLLNSINSVLQPQVLNSQALELEENIITSN